MSTSYSTPPRWFDTTHSKHLTRNLQKHHHQNHRDALRLNTPTQNSPNTVWIWLFTASPSSIVRDEAGFSLLSLLSCQTKSSPSSLNLSTSPVLRIKKSNDTTLPCPNPVILGSKAKVTRPQCVIREERERKKEKNRKGKKLRKRSTRSCRGQDRSGQAVLTHPLAKTCCPSP